MFSCFPFYSSDVIVSQKTSKWEWIQPFSKWWLIGGLNDGGNILLCMKRNERKPRMHQWRLLYERNMRLEIKDRKTKILYWYNPILWRHEEQRDFKWTAFVTSEGKCFRHHIRIGRRKNYLILSMQYLNHVCHPPAILTHSPSTESCISLA